ncbi:MAG: GerMN domain-containing protein [Pisciglobus halotolerans]|nr:GerMN domain-containing protein [Pisciglobus halotolerans]
MKKKWIFALFICTSVTLTACGRNSDAPVDKNNTIQSTISESNNVKNTGKGSSNSSSDSSSKSSMKESKSSSHSYSETKKENDKKQSAVLADFFPNTDNIVYTYEGKGNEFAGYKQWTDYSSKSRKQFRKDNGGTQSAQVIVLQNMRIVSVYESGGIEFRENRLKEFDNQKDILLRTPLEVGNEWQSLEGAPRSITDVAAEIQTPYGEFQAIEVTTTDKNFKTKDYYASGIGLVKTVYRDKKNDTTIESSLKSIEKEPFIQTIRFYYPDEEGNHSLPVEKNVEMKTNEETKKALAKAYKEVPDDRIPVLPEQTSINSLYLNKDGKAYVDFSTQLITDMNLGSGYEEAAIQSLVNTIGEYYGVKEVYLTVENKPYQSGHLEMEKGQFFEVHTDNEDEEHDHLK